MAETIGFIGLGVMGRPMAKNPDRRGHRLVVHNRSRGPVDELVAAGADGGGIARRGRPREPTIVITMLPDTPDVEQVLTGPDGVLAALQPGSVVIDMSSISPVATRRLAALVAEQGGTMLDAPVSGGEIGAINATLSIMVGGDGAAFERVRPILEMHGQPRTDRPHRHEPGSGQICKVCNQIAIGGALAGVSEAFALAQKAGVDRGARAPGAARRLRREPRARSPRRADAQGQLQARVSARSCIRRTCGSRTKTAARARRRDRRRRRS